ncbi:MAG: hypothetical protein EOM08_11010 [Clostridia bacterium]|nr:hypothetical protein [Clostridia bacterium]
MLKLVTAPTVEPVTLSEVKAQAVIGHDMDDALLSVMISAAREHGESLTGRSWAPKTLEVVLDRFPVSGIDLPASPVTAVTSIKYFDVDGAEQTMPESGYYVDTESLVGRVVPGSDWPETADRPNAVRVRYEAGFPAGSIPPALKQWLLIRVATLYEHREALTMVSNNRLVLPLDRSFVDGLLDAHTVIGGL